MTECPSSNPPDASLSAAPDEAEASCRLPLLVLFAGAAFWLVVSSVLGIMASIKFHSPEFFANAAWLGYGRLQPAATNVFLYGFAVPAGLGVALWIIVRLGRGKVSSPGLMACGGKIWNLGVLAGVIAVLAGDNTGFDCLEFPRYAALLLLVGYLLIGLFTILTLHRRVERRLDPSQWFLIAAIFWFPWIYSTACLLLMVCPVRGVAQAVVAWWYSANLVGVWLGLVGLAALFYFLPRLTNRSLHSRYLALFAFWTFILFASWNAIPPSAPTPVWMPTLSAIAAVLTLVPVLAVAVNIFKTAGCPCVRNRNNPRGRFIAFGLPAFVLAGLMKSAAALPGIRSVTQFTWFAEAQSELAAYGFFGMTMLGAMYVIAPRVANLEWPSAKMIRAHFWLATGGVALIVVPLAVGGIAEGARLLNPEVPFGDLSRGTLLFLRISSTGEVFILAGHLLFLANLSSLAVRYVRIHFVPVCQSWFAVAGEAEVKP